MFCKTIILSNTNNLLSNAPKGILTLSKETNYIKGKIRLYNIQSLPASTKVGIYANDKVYISQLDKKSSHYEFEIRENINIAESVYCALIDTANNKQVLLEGGSFNGFCFSDSPFDAVLEAKDDELEKNIDKALNDVDTCQNCNCQDCEYKKYFYQSYNQDNSISSSTDTSTLITSSASQNLDTISSNNQCDIDMVDKIQQEVILNLESELIQDIKKVDTFTNLNDVDNNQELIAETPHLNNQPAHDDENLDEKLEFLNDIIYQLDEMLVQYPSDDIISSIIPNSRFVRVDGDNPYIVGVIYEDKMLKYIAYGVPATYNTLPPADLGQHYQWLPLNPNDVMSDGYFMIYQDATNGTIVEINFEE